MKNEDEKEKLYKGFNSEFSESQIIIFLKELLQYRKNQNRIELKNYNESFNSNQLDGLRIENEILQASVKYLQEKRNFNKNDECVNCPYAKPLNEKCVCVDN